MKIKDIQYKFLKTDKFEERNLPLPRFFNNIYDSYKGEAFGEYLCLAPDYDWDNPVSEKIYGYIKYSYYNSIAYIQMIEVNDLYKRMGIAAELIHQFAQVYDKIELSLQTEDGKKFFDFMKKHGYTY